MLTRVYVDNFRCFVNFDFRPGPRQLLLGPNGSGKSTLFEVLARLRDFTARGLPGDGLFMGDTLTRWQRVDEQRFVLEADGYGGTFQYELVLKTAGRSDRPYVTKESLYHDKQPVFLSEKGRALLFDDTHHETAGFPPDIFRSGLAAITPPDAGFERFAWFKRWLGSVQCVRIDPFRMDGRADKEAIFAEADFGNFASWYRHLVLEQSAAVGDLRDTLRETIDGFDSLDLKEAGRGVRLLTVILRSSDHDVPVQSKGRFDLGFEELSDGQRALIGLYTVLHCFAQRGALLCIDEPDNFISLAEIQPWLQRLEDRADDEEAQLLLISHHPELLNQLAADHGIVFSRPGGRHVTVTPYKGAPGSELPPAEQIARGWADG